MVYFLRTPSIVFLVTIKSSFRMIFCILQTHNRKRKNLIKWNFKLAPLPSVVVAQRPVQDWWTLDPCCPGHRNTPGPSGHAPPMAHPRGPSYEVLYHTSNTSHCPLDLQKFKIHNYIKVVICLYIKYFIFYSNKPVTGV